MPRTASAPLVAFLLVAAVATCGAAVTKPLQLQPKGNRRMGRGLSAPSSTAAADERYPLADVVTSRELPPGQAVHISDSFYRLVGPQVSITDPRFEEAMRNSLNSAYDLFNVSVDVSIMPVVSATRKAKVGRRLLKDGSTTTAAGSESAGGDFEPERSVTQASPAAARAEYLVTQFAAVVAKVESYVTHDTTFSRVMQRAVLSQHRLLEGNLLALGYQVQVVPLGFLVPNAGLAVLRRLPPAITQNTQSYLQGIFRFSNQSGAIPVAAQSALLAYIDIVMPPFMISANMTGIAPAAKGSYNAAVLFVIGKTLQEFGPQDLQQVLASNLTAYMAAAGVAGNVSLLSTRGGTDLNPFVQEERAIASGCCKTITTEPIPVLLGEDGHDHDDHDDHFHLSTGAVAGVVVGALAAAAALLAACLFALWRRRQRRTAAAGAAGGPYGSGSSTGKGGPPASQLSEQPVTGWAILPEQLEVCRHSDGSEWLLGAGASGKVVKALRGGVQDVAVKQLLHTNAAAVEKFLEEVSILRSLNYDRNVVQFYGACLQEGSDPMLVTEYMEGGDLCSAIERDAGGELKWYRDGHRIALDIAKGLYFLHSHDVMHGDIKSRNVLLTRARTAKLADIGLARIVDPGTQASSEQWTFAYAAPEVILGQPAGLKSDIFSMGVVLHEVVTGIMPVTRGNLPEPSVPGECPEDVLDLIHACTNVDAGLRPTAKEVFTVLQRSCETHVPRFRMTAAAAAAANAASNRLAGRGGSDKTSGSSGDQSAHDPVPAKSPKQPRNGKRGGGGHKGLRGSNPMAHQQVADGIGKHSASSIDMGLATAQLLRNNENGTAPSTPAADGCASRQQGPVTAEAPPPAPPEHDLEAEPHQLSFGGGMTPGHSVEYDRAFVAEVLAAVHSSGSADIEELLTAVKALGGAGTADALRAAATAAAADDSSRTGERSCNGAAHRVLSSGSALYGDPVVDLPSAGSSDSTAHSSVQQESGMGSGLYSAFE